MNPMPTIREVEEGIKVSTAEIEEALEKLPPDVLWATVCTLLDEPEVITDDPEFKSCLEALAVNSILRILHRRMEAQTMVDA